MEKDIDILIKEEHDKLNQFKSPSEKIRELLVVNLTIFIREWYEGTAREYVAGKVDITEKLGEERLKQMKEKVLQLIKDAEKIANEELSDCRLWSVFDPSNIPGIVAKHKFSEADSNGAAILEGLIKQGALEEVIRFALGRIIPILQEFGYPAIHEKLLCTKCDGIVTHLRYPYRLDLPKELEYIIKQYQELRREAMRVHTRIHNLQEEKRNKKARDLWDSI
jgi:hypothetical protein